MGGGGASYTDAVAVAADILRSELTCTNTYDCNQKLLGSATEYSNDNLQSTREADIDALEVLPGETSSPASPSEGSESLGSHSQTEMASVIERGDTATPDTHSDTHDQDTTCSDVPESDTKLFDGSATSVWLWEQFLLLKNVHQKYMWYKH